MATAYAPLVLTLYNGDDSVKEKFVKTNIAWGVLKKAVNLQDSIDLSDLSKLGAADMDAIASLVVEVFGDRFSIDDLDKGASIQDMVSVMQGITAKAAAAMNGVNPSKPPKDLPKPKRPTRKRH